MDIHDDSSERELHRFLFLDVDSVLTTIEHADYLVAHGEESYDEDGNLFDPEAVENLAYIVEKVPDVKIVISSSLRFKGWEWMNRLWEKRLMPGKIYSFTPVLKQIYFSDIINQSEIISTRKDFNRGVEVEEWLRQNVKMGDLYFYAILGDSIDYLFYQAKFVASCNVVNGLTKSVAEKIVDILYTEFGRDSMINFDKMPHSIFR